MRKTALVVVMAALGVLAGCGNSNYDPKMCDFYQSLIAGYQSSQGYAPIDVQNDMHKYCDQ